MSETSKLLEIARKALNQEQSSDDLITSIEEYISAFEIWSNKGLFETLKKEEGEEVLELHKQVVEKAQNLKQDMELKRTELNKKAKGVLSYLDTLPKRVSHTRGRKG